MREKDKVNDERKREKKNEREWEVSCFLFLVDNKGHFWKIKCFISFFSICRLSLGVGFKYETYEDLLSIFGPSWAQNTILPINKPVFFFLQLNSKLSSHYSQLTRGVCASNLFNPFTPIWFLHLNFIFFSLVFFYFFYIFAISLWVFVLAGYNYGVEGWSWVWPLLQEN